MSDTNHQIFVDYIRNGSAIAHPDGVHLQIPILNARSSDLLHGVLPASQADQLAYLMMLFEFAAHSVRGHLEAVGITHTSSVEHIDTTVPDRPPV